MLELNPYLWLISLVALALIGFGLGLVCERANRKAEMRALERYRMACNTAGRWLAGHTPVACETAYWIQDVAEGKRPDDIEKFREQLRSNARHKPTSEAGSA